MSQKSHQDPITYHAYGKILGIYRPSSEDLTKGSLTTEDGTIFPATLTEKALTEIKQNVNQLTQTGIWRCYFRTRPYSLQLIRVKFTNLKYTGKVKVDDFKVVGEVIKVAQEKVTVQIKKNQGTGKAFNLSLKGTFDYDPAHKFYRFELKREGRLYRIVRWRKAGLPPLSKNENKEEVNQPQVLLEKKPVILRLIKKK